MRIYTPFTGPARGRRCWAARAVTSWTLLGGLLWPAAAAALAEERPRPPERINAATLRVVLELASDFSAGSEPLQADVLKLLGQQGAASDAERLFALQSFAVGLDADYAKSVEAEGKDSFDCLRAARASYARYKGAQQVPDQKWVETHLRGARRFAGMAADTLLAEAALDEEDANLLSKQPWAARRAPDKQAAFIERLRRDGLPAAHRKLLLESGRTEAEVEAFTKQLLDAPPDTIGASAVELLFGFAAARRELAGELKAYARAGAAALAVPAAQTFLVHNPRDQPETIDLMVRRVSIPASWKLIVVDAPEPAATAPVEAITSAPPPADSVRSLVQEVRAGEHYRVALPAKGQIRVASVVVPMDSVGENTTARWAVEGFIRDELIGGMVHEMSVPAVLPVDEPQPVAAAGAAPAGAAASVPAEPPASGGGLWKTLAATAIALAVGMLVLLLYRRRRPEPEAPQ